MQSVTVQYVVAGKAYTLSTSERSEVLNEFTPDTIVSVIYNRDRPGDAQAFPAHNVSVEEPSLGTVAWDTVYYIITAVLVIGQTVIAVLILGSMGKAYLTGAGIPMVLGVLALSLLELRLIEKWLGNSGPAYEAQRKLADRAMVVLAVVAVIWTPLAIRGVGESERAVVEREKQSAAERAERAKIERDSRGVLEKVRTLKEQRERNR